MITKLENKNIGAIIKSDGAELTNLILKKDNTEYLWGGNPDIWRRHAPVLFPIVGKVIDNQYKIGDRTFEMLPHGFARDMNFAQVEETTNRVTYRLTSNEQTLSTYPYKFQLDIGYVLEDSGVIITYHIQNVDDRPIHFSIGAHPGFNCPLLPDEKFEDYYLEFQQRETADRYFLENGLLVKKELFLQNENILPLSNELFKNDALIFKNLQSNQIVLKNKNSEKTVTVRYKDFPYMGIWSYPAGAPFICIEPWCGITDTTAEIKDFSNKEGIQCLEVGQKFEREYSISLT